MRVSDRIYARVHALITREMRTTVHYRRTRQAVPA